MRKIEVEQVKVVVIGESFPWDSVIQTSDSWEEIARVELSSHQWNTKVVRLVRSNVCSMSDLSREVRIGRTKESLEKLMHGF